MAENDKLDAVSLGDALVAHGEHLRADRSTMSNELSKMRKDGLISYLKNEFTLNEAVTDISCLIKDLGVQTNALRVLFYLPVTKEPPAMQGEILPSRMETNNASSCINRMGM